MSPSHKPTHTFSFLHGRKGLWLKLGALTILMSALVFAFTTHRKASANAAALDKAHATLLAAMTKLKNNRTAENTKETQKALSAYRALGGTQPLGGSMQVSAPRSSKAVAFGVSRPIRELTSAVRPGQVNPPDSKDPVRGKKNEFPVKTINPNAPGTLDTKIQSVARPRASAPNIDPPIVNFEGLNGDGNIPIFGGRVLPPDTVGDVGPNHYVQSVNTLFRVFDKTGTALTPVLTLGSLWSSIPGACANANDGDPIVLYDPLADRWLISQFCTVANPNNHQLIAISQTADPTGAYYLYDFMMPNNKFNDYPHFGVWPDGYYMSDNQFNQAGTAFLGAGAFAFERKKMLQGDPTASFIYFDVEPIDPNAGGLLPTDLDGVVTPPLGMPNVFMEFRADEFGDPLDAIRPYEFHADFAVPANSTFTVRPDVALAAFDARNPAGRGDIEQPAGGVNLDSIGDRLMHRLAYRTLAGGVQSFVLNFTVNVSGVNPTSAANYQTGVRWTELRRTGTLAGTISVNDQGTFAPGAGNGATGRNIWMASAAQDYLGNIGVGYSASSTTVNSSILYAGRLVADPAGTLGQGENTIVTGGGVQTSTSNRWGDYSALSVDPVDETTFWYTQEYYAITAGADWRTRVGSFKVDPNAVAQPKGTINGTVTNCATMQPIAGVVIMTADGFFRQSDGMGNFSFPVAPGTYTVMVIPPPGYSGGCTQTVTVAGGGTATVNCCLTPVPVMAAAGATLTAESCQPTNGAIDPGETVTVSFCVQNTGTANTANLVGTLAATGGVASPSGPQNYGVVVAGGPVVCRSFTFTANGTCGGTITASLQLQDGANNLGTVTYTFNLGALGAPVTTTYSSGNIAVPIIDSGSVDVPITVADTGVVQDINVRVRLNHTFDGDLVISLVAPDNTVVALANTRGGTGDNYGTGANDCSGTPTVFDDAAATAISAGTAPFAATFRPEALLSAMNGKPSNGIWKLRVADTAAIDVGTIGCFTLEMTRAAYVCCVGPVACTLTCPTNITVPNDANQCGAVVTYSAPTTSGSCGPVTCSPMSGSFFPVGATTVTCTEDTSGRGQGTNATCSFTVTVQDTQAPTVTCPANITVPNTTGQCNAAVTFTATATDNCPGVTVTCSPASGATFAVGTTTVTCTASDASPDSPNATCSFTVTVQDTQPPAVTCPANITVPNTTGQCSAAVTYTTPAGTDNCGTPTVSCVPASGSTFAVGTTTVTCTASDASANSADATCMFTVTVQDTQAPTITCPANQNAVSPGGGAVTVNYPAPTATDNCPGVTTSCIPASGTAFAVGTTTVTCTASDASPNSPDATCSFTVTVVIFVPVPTANLVDPLACAGPGDLVLGSFGLTNTTVAPQIGAITTTLPATILALPGTCVANVGTCIVNSASTITWSGTLAPGETLTVNYQAQLADGVLQGTTHCATTTAVFSGATGTVQACLTVNCPAAGPGLIPAATSPISDQKAGSVLLYPVYTSDAANGSTQNTRVSITNVHPSRAAFVHLFFVDGTSCSVADSYICLTANQTATVLTSDIDPGTTGYIVAVATDRIGCPINFNYLIGDEYVKFASGHAANLGAEAVSAIAGGLTNCNLNSVTAQLNFDGVSYNALPRVLASSNLPSRGDGNDTLFIVDRIGGNLSIGAATIGTLFGLLYDDAERAFSFQLPAGTCQTRGSITNDRPRTVPRFETVIPAGRSGWLKAWGAADIGIIGAQINRNLNAGSSAGAFNQGHNLHKLTLTTSANYVIPVFPPSC